MREQSKEVIAMPNSRIHRRAAALWLPVALLMPGAGAFAWTPSTAPAQVDGEPVAATDAPGNPGYAPPPTGYYGYPPLPPPRFGQPGAYSAPALPSTPLGTNGTGEPAPSGATVLRFAGMTLTLARTESAYTLDIALGDIDATQVQIGPAGQLLMVVVNRSEQATREEQFDDGRGYRRSFSYSSGRSVKRLPAPPDANLAALQREDADGRIHVTIPRLGRDDPATTPQPERQ
jgi:hypothetical protein